MFSIVKIQDYIRVEPKLFGLETKKAVEKQLQETYSDHIDKEIGAVIGVIEVSSVGEGIIIPGDGAAYYLSDFKLLVWKPELQELVFGTISEITNFGAFIDLGAMKGMIHISQTMEDYVSLSKTGSLLGKSTKKSLNKNDKCLARIVAISYKAGEPKLSLTMRQPGLGKLDWIKEEKRKAKLKQKAIVPETKEKKK